MRKETERKIGWISGAILILSDLLLWVSPRLGWDVLKDPDNSWTYFLGALTYFWFLYQVWKKGKTAYKKYLWLMFLTEAVYNVATLKASSFITLPFYAAVGIGMLLFLPENQTGSDSPKKAGWAKKIAFGCIAMVLGSFTVIAIVMPPDKFLPESNIPKKIHQTLQKTLTLGKDEQIRYFITDGMLSFEKSFIVLTDRSIHIVQRNNAIPYLIIPFADIAGIDSEIKEGFWDDDEITLRLSDGREHELILYSPKESKRKLVEKLQAMTDFKSKI